MLTVHKRKDALPGPIESASHQFSNPSILADEEPESSGDSLRLKALRVQFARLGMEVCTTCGPELVLTGRGLAQLAPDIRSAWLVLRQINGGRL